MFQFHDLDLSDFWEPSEYATREYVDEAVSDQLVVSVERTLGYSLPQAYVALMRSQNGGIPRRTCHRTATKTSWAADHVAVHGLFAIGSRKPNALCGELGSAFWCQEWGYPPIGVYFADCPSAGHDMFCLDYRACGPQGEPAVVHIDQEWDYAVTHVADDFASFIRGLQPADAFEVG